MNVNRKSAVTVSQAWELYRPVAKRDNRSWSTEAGRAKHVLRHLGDHVARALNVAHVDTYRDKRFAETTQRGAKPSPATVDREVELLKRVLNYAVKADRMKENPIAGVKLLRKPNVRREVVDEATFAKLCREAPDWLEPILMVAFETGMRKQEVLGLKWSQVDLRDGVIRLESGDTKTEKARLVLLTDRAHAALDALPRALHSDYVFVNSDTGKRRMDIRPAFGHATAAIGRPALWFHDLRRSFVTNARKRGIPESVVMRMSGHKTTAVFARYNIVDDKDLREARQLFEAGQRMETDQEQDRQDPDNVATRASLAENAKRRPEQ